MSMACLIGSFGSGVPRCSPTRWSTAWFLVEGLAVTAEQSAFVARLRAELDALREQVAQQQAEHEQALAAKAAELAVQVKAVDALGKAIEILHHAGAGKSSQPQDRAEGQRP